MRRRRGGTRDWRRRHGPSPLVQAPGATWPSFVAQQASQPPAYLEWIVVEAVAAAPLPPPFSPPPSAYKYLPSTRAMTSPFTTPAPLFLFFSFPRGDLSWRRQAAGLGTTGRGRRAAQEQRPRESSVPIHSPDVPWQFRTPERFAASDARGATASSRSPAPQCTSAVDAALAFEVTSRRSLALLLRGFSSLLVWFLRF
jgi:hypothetical protein